jgi:hypothetical protein
MLYFVNPDHVPGTGTRPSVTILDKDDLNSRIGFIAKSVGIFEDGLMTDGWIVRDIAFEYKNANVYCIVTLTNVLRQQFEGRIVLTAPTKAALLAAEIPPQTVTGDCAIVLEDESADGFNKNSEMLYSINMDSQTPVFDPVACIGLKYRVLYTAQGHSDITFVPNTDTGPLDYRLTFVNRATTYTKLLLSNPHPIVPAPNDVVALPATTADWLIGDLITVGYGDPFVQQFDGVFEGSNEQGYAKIRVFSSEFRFGGVQQYSSFDQFPTPATNPSDVSEDFLYIAQDTQLAYSWNAQKAEYLLVTDIRGKADKFIIGNVEYNLQDVFNLLITLRNEFDADHLDLTQHITNTVIHITAAERTLWNKTAVDAENHIADTDLHFDKVNVEPVQDTVKKSDVRLHLQDAAKSVRATHHMTAQDWVDLAAKATKEYVDTADDVIHKLILTLTERLDALSNLGRYLKTVDTYNNAGGVNPNPPPANFADSLLEITAYQLFMEFPGRQPNDFINIRVDETHDNASARYVLVDVGNPGASPGEEGYYPTWKFDIILDQDISGLMDAMVNGEPGYIPTVGAGGYQLDGTQIDPATLATVAALEAHETGVTPEGAQIHVTDEDRENWDTASVNIADHIANTIRHITAAERTAWDAVVTAFATHDADNTRHITAAERTAWNAKADQTALQAEITARSNADDTINARIDNIRDTGLYLDTVATYDDLPSVKGSNNWKVGDWMLVVDDEKSGQNAALYQIRSITSDGALTWGRDHYWQNTAVNTFIYRRILTFLDENVDGADPIPSTVQAHPECYFDMFFAEEQATMRFVLGRNGSQPNRTLFRWFMTTKKQRVTGLYIGHYFDFNTVLTEDVRHDAGANHDSLRWIRNFGTSPNSLLNTWYSMEDTQGQPMGNQEVGQTILFFEETGNFYELYIGDSGAYEGTDVRRIPFVRVSKANTPAKTTLADADRTITID